MTRNIFGFYGIITVLGCCVILVIGRMANAGEQATSFPSTSLAQESDEALFTKIDQLTEKHDLAAIGILAKDIRSTFRKADPVRYGKLMSKVCDNLGTFDFKDDRRHGLASSLSLDALEFADRFPLAMELGFVEHLRYDMDASGALNGARWNMVRRKQVEAWLHAMRRLRRLTEEKWDPTYQPALNMVVPGFEDVPAGAAPSIIPDPKRRQEYADALSAERERAERYLAHMEALRRISHEYPRFEKYIVAIYSKPPYANAELRNLLKQSGIDASEQSRILHAVEVASTKASSRPSASTGRE